MSGFKFERNLPHQGEAVESVLKAFDGASAVPCADRAMAKKKGDRLNKNR